MAPSTSPRRRRALPRLLQATAKSGAPVRLFKSHKEGIADGEQRRDFIYVDDAVNVLRWLLERKFSLDLLRQFSELRLAIEPTAAAFAAQYPDSPAIAAIEAGFARMKSAAVGEDDVLEADIQFHIAILHATQNPFFGQFEELVRTALHTSIQFTNQFSGHTANVDQHREVLEAIKAGQGDQARATMYRLIADVLALIHKARQSETDVVGEPV